MSILRSCMGGGVFQVRHDPYDPLDCRAVLWAVLEHEAMFFKTARRVVIAVVGATVVLVGIVMIVLPGPAIVVIPAGLAILGIEFAWAARLLKRVKRQAHKMFNTGGGGEADKAPTTKENPPVTSVPQ